MADRIVLNTISYHGHGAIENIVPELTAVPSILVPYPHATADHQTTNARYLVDAGAGVLCADADIDGSAFILNLKSSDSKIVNGCSSVTQTDKCSLSYCG